MIRRSEKLEALERWYTREYLSRLTYHEALGLFAAMWREARAVNPNFPGDWRDDIAADVELARVVNAPLPADT